MPAPSQMPDPDIRRGPWSTAEDKRLLELINHQTGVNWVRISGFLSSRSAKQCRERYHQNLKPSLNHGPITPEEGVVIDQLVETIGRRWAEIARRLKGRSDNAVKNWWNGNQNRRKRLESRRRGAGAGSPTSAPGPAYRQPTPRMMVNQPSGPPSHDAQPQGALTFPGSSAAGEAYTQPNPNMQPRPGVPTFHDELAHRDLALRGLTAPSAHSSHEVQPQAAAFDDNRRPRAALPSLASPLGLPWPPTSPVTDSYSFNHHYRHGDMPLPSPCSSEPPESDMGSYYTFSPSQDRNCMELPPLRTQLPRTRLPPTYNHESLPSLRNWTSKDDRSEPFNDPRPQLLPTGVPDRLSLPAAVWQPPTAPSSPLQSQERQQQQSSAGNKDSRMKLAALLG
ncbi:hypothetical protein XA68_14079 [Ophiocordyceps unilateralis]|uniref:Uncharacterized protein n=1 Tax=Ophiocordyceps unilateralis TaxID=268505 RepID=A0A2A9P9I0_OPHUN|nr:hypothetical protein XA68_14079 [Ophiocordyceps unilateralis]